MADYLQILLKLTEKFMINLEGTRKLLNTWETQMQYKEVQELYN